MMKTLIAKNQLVTFTFLTLFISWACWLPIINSIEPGAFSSPIHVIALLLLGGYGPSIAAIIVTGITGGKKSIGELLRKFLIFRVGWKWYVVALLLAPVILLISTHIFLLRGGELGWINYQVILWLPVFYLVAAFFGPLGEELGWRGFLLAGLEKKGLIISSIIVGLIWTLWHVPLFWAAEGTSISGIPVTIVSVLRYLVFVLGTSFIYTWVFKNTKGSVFMALLLHMSSNGIHTAMGYFLPNLMDKRGIWNIEVFVYAAIIVLMITIYLFKKKNHIT